MIRRTLTFIGKLEAFQFGVFVGCIIGFIAMAVLFVEGQMLLSMAKGGM